MKAFVITMRLASNVSLLTVLAVLHTPSAHGHPLGGFAAQMSPGTWRELSTNGFGGGTILETYGAGRYIIQYCEDAAWDPVRDQLLILGASHGDPTTETLTKFLRYDATTNSWQSSSAGALPNPPLGYPTHLGHCYDHDAINPATGIFYHRLYGSNQVMQFNNGTSQWTSTLTITSMGPKQVAGGLTFFPDLGNQGSLVFVDGDWGVHRYNLASSQWTQIASTNGGGMSPQLPMGAYHNFTEHNPMHRVVIFGGGDSRKLYKVDSSGNLSTMRDAPLKLGTTNSIVTTDPVSGKYLVLFDTSQFYEYDVANDTWNLLPSSQNPPFFGGLDGSVFGTVATPIAELGVVIFVNYEFPPASRVYLYKHAAGTPQAAPAPPSNLQAN